MLDAPTRRSGGYTGTPTTHNTHNPQPVLPSIPCVQSRAWTDARPHGSPHHFSRPSRTSAFLHFCTTALLHYCTSALLHFYRRRRTLALEPVQVGRVRPAVRGGATGGARLLVDAPDDLR
jgi:hypothetical protein